LLGVYDHGAYRGGYLIGAGWPGNVLFRPGQCVPMSVNPFGRDSF
jgi:hypothetical protein